MPEISKCGTSGVIQYNADSLTPLPLMKHVKTKGKQIKFHSDHGFFPDFFYKKGFIQTFP